METEDNVREAMAMLKPYTEPETVIEFHPPTDRIVSDSDGNKYAVKTDPYIKIGVGFRRELKSCKGAPLAVFMSICLHINEHGKSWPGIRTICEETGYESATVVAAIRKLKEIGLVRVTPRKRSETTIYEPMLAAFGKSNPKVFRKSKHPGVSESETQVFQKVKHGVSESETKEEPKKKNQEEEPIGADARTLAPSGEGSEATSPRRRRDPFEIEADFEARRAQGRAAGLDRAAAAHPLAGRWPHLVDLARSFEEANGTRLADLPKSQVPLWAKQLEGHYQADLTPDDERELVRMAKAKKWDLYSPGSADKLIGHLRRKSATISEPTYAKPSF